MMWNLHPLTTDDVNILRRQIISFREEEDRALWDPSSRTYLLMDLLDEYGLKVGGGVGDRLLAASRMLRKKPFDLHHFRSILEPLFQVEGSEWPKVNEAYQEDLRSIFAAELLPDGDFFQKARMMMTMMPSFRFPKVWDGIVWPEEVTLTGYWVGKLRSYLSVSDPLKVISLRMERQNERYVTLDLQATNWNRWEDQFESGALRVVSKDQVRRYYLNQFYPVERFVLLKSEDGLRAYSAETFLEVIASDLVRGAVIGASQKPGTIIYRGRPIKFKESSLETLGMHHHIALFDRLDHWVGMPCHHHLGQFNSVRDKSLVVNPLRSGCIPLGVL